MVGNLLQNEADAIAAKIASLQNQAKLTGDDGSVQSPAAIIQSLIQQLKDNGYRYVDGKAIPVSGTASTPSIGKGDAMVVAMKIHGLTFQSIPQGNGRTPHVKYKKWAEYPKDAIDLVGQLNTAGYIFVPTQSAQGYLLAMNDPKAATYFGGQTIDSMTPADKGYIQQQIIDGLLK